MSNIKLFTTHLLHRKDEVLQSKFSEHPKSKILKPAVITLRVTTNSKLTQKRINHYRCSMTVLSLAKEKLLHVYQN